LSYWDGRQCGEHRTSLEAAVGTDFKGRISVVLYIAAIPLAFVQQLLSDAIYVSVALMWLIPDRRIEERFADAEREERP
jgi:uncharacterized membrane protein